MRSSREWISLSVGVLIAVGNAAPGMSQSVSEQFQPTTRADFILKSLALTSPENSPESETARVESTQHPGPGKQSTQPTALATAKPKLTQQRATEPTQLKPSNTQVTQPAPSSSTRQDDQASETQQAQTTPTPGSAQPNAAPAGTTPNPVTPAPTPAPSTVPDVTIPSRPTGPAKPGLAPGYLTPPPNPLTFPTQPEEVRTRGTQPITLNQAIELAKRNNRTLQTAQIELDQSRAVLREAEAALYPTVEAQAQIQNSRSTNTTLSRRLQERQQESLPPAFRQPLQGGQPSTALTGTVSVNYPVYTSGLRPAQIRAAQQQLRFRELAVEVTEEQLRFDVADDYYSLQEADESVRINQSAVRNAQASLRDTLALERAGLGTRFDVLRAQVQLANAQQALRDAVAQQEISRRRLAQRLAVPPYVELAAADPVAVAGQWNLSLPESTVLAYKNRAELEQQLAQRELAEQRRRAALAGLGPQVSVTAAYNVLDSFGDDTSFVGGYSLGAGLQWQLFDGGAARARANQEEANKALAETGFAQTREQINFEVEQSYATLQSSLENITTTEQALEQAREALRLARLRFQAGVGTQTDVINAENDLTRAEGNRIQAIIGYNRALAALQRAVSNLPIAVGQTQPTLP